MMMTDDDLLRLSAFADDELGEADRRAVDEALHRDPELRRALDAFTKLRTAAQNEIIPQPSLDRPTAQLDADESLLSSIATRSTSCPDELVERFQHLAAAERTPD